MAGGLDILIVGIAGKNLDHIAPDAKLRELFDNQGNPDQYLNDFHALSRDYNLENPRIFYLATEHLYGAQMGTGLGYIIFDGNLNELPRKLDIKIFLRTSELKHKFVKEVKAKGLTIKEDDVGLYALNVYDT